LNATLARQRAGALTAAALAPVPVGAWQRVFPKDLISLCYHVVSDEDLPHQRVGKYKGRRQFEDDVLFARDRAVSYEEVVAHRLRGVKLASNSLFFTFDDGNAECFSVIRPVLLRHGVGAAFFVATDFVDDGHTFEETKLSLCLSEVEHMGADRARELVGHLGSVASTPDAERVGGRRLDSLRVSTAHDADKRRLLLWILHQPDIDRACEVFGVDAASYARGRQVFMRSEQIKQLSADGFTIGAHGLNHSSLEGKDATQIEREIVESCAIVRDLSGQARVPFAFPYIGVSISREVLGDIMKRHPFVELFFDSGLLRRDRAFVVNRVFADMPSPGTGSNLPSVLRDAWSRPSAWFRTAPLG
jgi:peptidoglycan/xylan/chitin deacetylase (PgdA/CDA1 family)